MAEFYGLAVYEIKAEGDLLHAVCTNSILLNEATGRYGMGTEIARRATASNESGLNGVYDCQYIIADRPNEVFREQLIINRRGEVYDFTWRSQESLVHVGIGMMAGPHHIAVAYSEP